MTLQDLGGIGEFIGGVGVIVSLLYLAIQIRQNSRIERLNARQSISESLSTVFERLETDAELRRIWQTARDTGEELSDEDRERLGMFLFRYFSALNIAENFSELDPSFRRLNEPLLLRFLEIPAIQGWWSRQRLYFAEPFRSKIDGHLRSIIQGQASQLGVPAEA